MYRVYGSSMGAVPAQRYQPARQGQLASSELKQAASAALRTGKSVPDNPKQGDPPGTAVPPLPERETWDPLQAEAELAGQEWAAISWENAATASGSFAPAPGLLPTEDSSARVCLPRGEASGTTSTKKTGNRSNSTSSDSTDSSESDSDSSDSDSSSKKSRPKSSGGQKGNCNGRAARPASEQLGNLSSGPSGTNAEPHTSKDAGSKAVPQEPHCTKLPRFWQPAPQPTAFLILHDWGQWRALPTAARSPSAVAAAGHGWESASTGIVLEITGSPRSPLEHAAQEGFRGLSDKELRELANNDFGLSLTGSLGALVIFLHC